MIFEAIIESQDTLTPRPIYLARYYGLNELFFPNKTINQVLQKKMHMGFKGRRKWSEEERGLLLEHGANYSHREMCKKFLPNKTPRQVTDMRKYFGIKRKCTPIGRN